MPQTTPKIRLGIYRFPNELSLSSFYDKFQSIRALYRLYDEHGNAIGNYVITRDGTEWEEYHTADQSAYTVIKTQEAHNARQRSGKSAPLVGERLLSDAFDAENIPPHVQFNRTEAESQQLLAAKTLRLNVLHLANRLGVKIAAEGNTKTLQALRKRIDGVAVITGVSAREVQSVVFANPALLGDEENENKKGKTNWNHFRFDVPDSTFTMLKIPRQPLWADCEALYAKRTRQDKGEERYFQSKEEVCQAIQFVLEDPDGPFTATTPGAKGIFRIRDGVFPVVLEVESTRESVRIVTVYFAPTSKFKDKIRKLNRVVANSPSSGDILKEHEGPSGRLGVPSDTHSVKYLSKNTNNRDDSQGLSDAIQKTDLSCLLTEPIEVVSIDLTKEELAQYNTNKTNKQYSQNLLFLAEKSGSSRLIRLTKNNLDYLQQRNTNAQKAMDETVLARLSAITHGASVKTAKAMHVHRAEEPSLQATYYNNRFSYLSSELELSLQIQPLTTEQEEFLREEIRELRQRAFDNGINYLDCTTKQSISLQALADRAAEKGVLPRFRKRLEDAAALFGKTIQFPQKTVEERVEEHLRKKQASKEFQDSEGRIKGSRKEKSAFIAVVNSGNLAELERDADNAEKQVIKEKVFPKFDVEQLRADGVSAGAAYFMVKLREAIPAKPGNSPEERFVYVTACEIMRKICTEGFSYDAGTVNEELLKKYNYNFRTGRYDICRAESSEDLPITIEQPLTFGQTKGNLNDAILEDFWTPAEDEDACKVISPLLQALLNNNLDMKLSKNYDNNVKSLIQRILGKQFFNVLKGYNSGSVSAAEISNKALQYEGITQEMQDKEFEEWRKRRYETLGDNSTYKRLKVILNDLISLEVFKRGADGSFIVDKAINKGVFNLSSYLSAILYLTEQYAKSQGVALPNLTEFDWNASQMEKDLTNIENAQKIADYLTILHKDGDINIENQMESDWLVNAQKFITLEAFLQKNPEFKARPDDWSWYETPKTSAPKKASGEIRINSFEPLQHIVRKGGLAIEDVSVESIKRIFGFKEVEFGNYVKDNEAKVHVKHFLGAMADLCEILNIHPHDVHKLRGLSIAFGSRGSKGALATYFPRYTIINLTKKKGDGCVAHEWGHYFDNAVYRGKGNRPYVSETLQEYFADTPNEVRNAFNQLFRAIKSGNSTIKETYLAQTKRRYRIEFALEKPTVEEALAAFKRAYSSYFNQKQHPKQRKEIFGQIAAHFKMPYITVEIDSGDTQWFTASKAMKSPYWASNVELFARAFETYVFEKLARAGRENNYLVANHFQRYKNSHGDCLFPLGEERERLLPLFDNLITAAKKDFTIRDFEPFTDKRVSETEENTGEDADDTEFTDVRVSETEENTGEDADDTEFTDVRVSETEENTGEDADETESTNDEFTNDQVTND